MRGPVNIDYAPSPTARRFHADRRRWIPPDAPEAERLRLEDANRKAHAVKAMIGPVGGGKTVALCMDILITAMEQQPDVDELFHARRHGRPVRPTRFAAVRQTYPQLESTLIKTFNEWTGRLGRVVHSSPIRFNAEFPLPDDTVVDLEVLFLALDGPNAADNLRSLEVTGIAVSEFREIRRDVFEMALSRIGRYPKTRRVDPGDPGSPVVFGPTNPQVFMESNPPATRSFWYQTFEIDRPKSTAVYKQPPAMLWDNSREEWVPNPEAENIANLPGGFEYYRRLVENNSREYVNVFVANNYGATFSGLPVFRAFSPHVHVVEDLEAARARLVIGMDFGLNPAAVLTQATPHGGVDVVDEVVDEGTTFEAFLDEQLLPLLRASYAGLPVQVVGDPAGAQRSALAHKTAMDMLLERGLSAVPAPSNDIALRLDAVNHFLERRGAMRVSPRCTTLIEALSGGYRFAALRGKDGVHRDVPEKNEYSHVADALQYACLHYYSGSVMRQRRGKLSRLRHKGGSGSPGFVWA